MSGDTTFNVPVANLGRFQVDRMRKYGDLVALVNPETERYITYSQCADRIEQIASGLFDLGLRQGDVLCALTFNTIEYPLVWYAVNLLGGTFLTASPLYPDEELERRFSKCYVKFLLTIPELTTRISSMVHRMKLATVSLARPKLLNKLIVLGEDCVGFIPFRSLLTSGQLRYKPEVDPSKSTALLLSSSGTTGLPKFVKLTHVNIIANMMQIQYNKQHQPGEVSVLALPVFHHYGLHSVLGTSLYNGIKVVLMERWSTEKFFANIEKYKVNLIQVVPAMAASLVKFPERHTYDVSSVRFVMSAAAPMGVGVEEHLRQLFNVPFISQSYGLTETGYNSGNTTDRHRLGSNGIPPIGTTLKIFDPETEEELPRNKTGEIRVKGQMVTPGYLDDDVATRLTFDQNGFFKTGDIGYLDLHGFLFIVDRLKELIKYKGLQVAPAYLEDIIVKHPGVADAVVIGIPDPDAGELPRAYVVRQTGSHITAKDIVQYVHDHVAPHMRLRGGVEFIPEVPRTPSGKIMRRHLKPKKHTASRL